jgi:alpha-beta hydrolase superfamily lysophospholipase
LIWREELHHNVFDGSTLVGCKSPLARATPSTVRVYDFGRHEIVNQVDRQEVVGDLLRWLDRFLS